MSPTPMTPREISFGKAIIKALCQVLKESFVKKDSFAALEARIQRLEAANALTPVDSPAATVANDSATAKAFNYAALNAQVIARVKEPHAVA